jgi:hypothetical protein
MRVTLITTLLIAGVLTLISCNPPAEQTRAPKPLPPYFVGKDLGEAVSVASKNLVITYDINGNSCTQSVGSDPTIVQFPVLKAGVDTVTWTGVLKNSTPSSPLPPAVASIEVEFMAMVPSSGALGTPFRSPIVSGVPMFYFFVPAPSPPSPSPPASTPAPVDTATADFAYAFVEIFDVNKKSYTCTNVGPGMNGPGVHVQQ